MACLNWPHLNKTSCAFKFCVLSVRRSKVENQLEIDQSRRKSSSPPFPSTQKNRTFFLLYRISVPTHPTHSLPIGIQEYDPPSRLPKQQRFELSLQLRNLLRRLFFFFSINEPLLNNNNNLFLPFCFAGRAISSRETFISVSR